MPQSLHDEFLDTAWKLARDGKTQADFRRSISTSYYALFHWLATCCADMLVGTEKMPRSRRAWKHVYRRLEHRQARNRCNELKSSHRDFPRPILRFAEQFVTLQEKRESADYDPDNQFLKTAAQTHVVFAILAIQGMRHTQVKDRRAFAVWVLFPKPRD